MNVILPEERQQAKIVLANIHEKRLLKFVSFGTVRDGITALFEHEIEHAQYADELEQNLNGLQFQGAGRVHLRSMWLGGKPDVEWGSYSCRRVYGREKPRNPDLATHIEEAIRREIVRITQDMQSSQTD